MTAKTILCNGIPKSGTHAFLKAVELLGCAGMLVHHEYQVGGLLPEDMRATTHHLFIKRDPRNVLISWLRFFSKPVTSGMFITAFRNWSGTANDGLATRTFLDASLEFTPWLSDPSVFVVKFEDLTASDAELRRIAAYLAVPYLEDAFRHLPGMTRTWTGKLSDYTAIWNADIESVWSAEGGPQLLKAWGYAD